jgi:hypothetical protein
MGLPFLQRGFPPIVADLHNGHGTEPLLDGFKGPVRASRRRCLLPDYEGCMETLL